jgi:hypothetical protein
MRLEEPKFDKAWFDKHQERLVRFANSRLGRWFFRLDLVGLDKVRIMQIGPHWVSHDWKMVNGRLQKTATFFPRPRFQKRLMVVYARAKRFLGIAAASQFLQPQGATFALPLFALTTDTFYPDASPESTSVDGGAGHTDVDSNTFADKRAATGNSGNDDNATLGPNLGGAGGVLRIQTGTTTNHWNSLTRIGTLFDTSALPDAADISAATYSLMLKSKGNSFSTGKASNVVTCAPASNTAFGSGDYQSFSFTRQCDTDATYASHSAEAYTDWALNATGLGNISKTGITKFGLAYAPDIDADQGTWASDVFTDLQFYSADNASGTSKAPKLAVTYTAATTYTLSLGETPGIIELFSRLWTAVRSRSESIVLQAESTSRTWAVTRGLPTDVVTITEAITGFKGRILDILESLGIVDSISRTWSATRSPSDTVSISEAVSKSAGFVRSVLDNVGITDTVTKGIALIRSMTDYVGITEYVSFPLNWLKRTRPTTTWTPRTKP